MLTLVWIGFAISMFAGSLMLAKEHKNAPDKILMIWLFLFAFDFLLRALEISLYGQVMMSNSFLLFNPLLYIYTKSLTQSRFLLKPGFLLHLIPFTLFEILIAVTAPKFTLNAFLEGSIDSFWFALFLVISILSWNAYAIFTVVLLRRYDKAVEEEFSSKNRFNNITWIKSVAYFYFIYCLVAIILGVYVKINHLDSTILVILISSVSLILVYGFSFFGIFQHPVFKVEKTRQSSISESMESKVESIKAKILDYFDAEKPYLESDFNMDVFSKKINIPKHQLTWILNQEIGKNFFRFTNDYRIEEAKKQLRDNNSCFSIEAIGYDCGFNSKSSFFTIFKKSTGMTPAQFRKKQAEIK